VVKSIPIANVVILNVVKSLPCKGSLYWPNAGIISTIE